MLTRYKPPMSTTSSAAADSLERLSKAALIDLYCQALAINLGKCDDPVSLEAVAEDAIPMLEMRGDKIPADWPKVYGG